MSRFLCPNIFKQKRMFLLCMNKFSKIEFGNFWTNSSADQVFCAVFCNFCSNLSNYGPPLYARRSNIGGQQLYKSKLLFPLIRNRKEKIKKQHHLSSYISCNMSTHFAILKPFRFDVSRLKWKYWSNFGLTEVLRQCSAIFVCDIFNSIPTLADPE